MRIGNTIVGRKAEYTVQEKLEVSGAHSHYKVSENGKTFFCKRYSEDRRFHAKPELEFLKDLSEKPHPNIIPLTDIDRTELIFIFPYVCGIFLGDYMTSYRKFAISDLRAVVDAVGSALGYLHEKELAHLDVKNDNIVLEGHRGVLKQGKRYHVVDGFPYLTDFGTIRSFGKLEEGRLIGSPCNSSPEQINEGVVDQRTDVYGLGATLYELLTGNIPFIGSGINYMLDAIVNDKVPRIDDYDSKISKDMADVVHKAMQKRKSDRFQSVDEMVKAFMQVT